MKKTQLSRAIEETIALKEKAVSIVIDKVIQPLTDVGSPETLIGKPYEQWLPQDLVALTKIYGTGDNTVLANLIFRREYARVKSLEREEGV